MSDARKHPQKNLKDNLKEQARQQGRDENEVYKDIDATTYTGGSWDLLAQHHCAMRNQAVATILGYCVLIRSRHAQDPFDFHAAQWQITRPKERVMQMPPEWEKRIDESSLSAYQRKKILVKILGRQDAHQLPCEIKLNGKPLEGFVALADQGTGFFGESGLALTLRGKFGAVDPLPTIFNEADSQAEKANLRNALAGACQSIHNLGIALSPGLLVYNQTQAYEKWLRGADLGFDQALLSNHRRHQEAHPKSYERLYREMKITVLEFYKKHTASQHADLGDIFSMLSRHQFV